MNQTTVQQLIDTAAQHVAEEMKEQTSKTNAQVAQAHKIAFGAWERWGGVIPEGTEPLVTYKPGNKDVAQVSWKLTAGDLPIVLVAQRYSDDKWSVRVTNENGAVVSLDASTYNRDNDVAVALGQFFVETAAYMDKVKQQKLNAQLNKAENVLEHANIHSGRENVEAAVRTLRALNEEFGPFDEVRVKNWQALYEAWQEKCRQAAEERARRHKVEEARKVALAEWQEANKKHAAEWHGALARNQQIVTAAQAELDRPFKAWLLCYGVVAEDHEVGNMVDLRSEYVLADEADEHGYWPVVANGRVQRIRYYNPASLTDAREITLDAARQDRNDLRFYHGYYVGEAEMYLYIPPTVEEETAVAMLREAGLEPLPEGPGSFTFDEDSVQ